MKSPPLTTWLWFSLTLIVSVPACGQGDYTDYRKSEVIFSDEFDEPRPAGWKQTGYDVNGGWAMRTHDTKAMALKDVQFNESRDFELELSAQLTFQKGIWPRIYLGDFVMVATCLNQFGTCNTGLMFWNKAEPYGKYLGPSYSVAPQISYDFSGAKPSLVTIRKVGGMMYYFINKELVGTASYKPFSRQTIGVFTVRAVDFIKLNYIEKATQALAVDERMMASPRAVPTGPVIVKSGGKHFALIIGVSAYQDNRLNLDHPTKDARKLRELLLTLYSFTDSTTFLVIDPTRQKIISELFRLRKVIGSNDNLLIFYAGHGYWDEAAQQGYWWPSDATPNDPSNWLSNSDVREQIRSIKSGHTLLISDACFSGGIFKTRSANSIRDAAMDIQVLYKMPSRRAITSGTMTAVPDKSVFFDYLAKRLQENQERYFASQQLFDSFRLAVINNSAVVPQDGVIAETGDEGGDFIFIRKN
jgi:hypothetical protein